MAQDKYAEALEQFKRLTEIEPSTSENYLRMAQLYRRLGKFDQAEASLLRAKQLAPGSLEVLYNEALLYEDQGRYDDAVKVLSDAIAGMKSQSSSARNSSRGCWSRQGAENLSGRRVESERAGDSLRATGARISRRGRLSGGDSDLSGHGQAER